MELEALKNAEKRVLETGIEPYRKDNARVVLENNELHNKLLEIEGDHAIELKTLKHTNRQLKNKIADLEFVTGQTLTRTKELEKELLEKGNRTLQLSQSKTTVIGADGTKKPVPVGNPTTGVTEHIQVDSAKLKDNLRESKAQADDVKVLNMVEVMERRQHALVEQLDDLRIENQRQSDLILTLKCQLNQRDREIDRLRHALEGGRPLNALLRDCCCQCQQKDCQIRSLESQLKESIEKQHEAMSRAVQLADRNQHLERELKDIDNMAMAVEEECHSRVKENSRSVDILQEKLREKIIEMGDLEKKVLNMEIMIHAESKKVDILNKEKRTLEKELQASLSEKKTLNDKINNFLIVEKNLSMEVIKLKEINKSLQRQLRDMEETVKQIMSEKAWKGKDKRSEKRDKEKCRKKYPSPQRRTSPSPSRIQKKDEQPKGKDSKMGDCLFAGSNVVLLDKLQQERDFYHKECHRLREQMCDVPRHSDKSLDLLRKLEEKEKEINDLKDRNRLLIQDQARLETGDHFSCPSGDSIKIMLERLERERDLAVSDLKRLQDERDSLKEKIKICSESHSAEHSRMERIILDNEDRIRRLENERRELINNQGAHRTTINTWEERCDEFKQQLRNSQAELAQMSTHYTQLKALQEETDRSLSDCQGRLTQTEVELSRTLEKVRESDKAKRELEDQISLLNREKSSLKTTLTCIEKEKDELLMALDEKTEKLAKMEGDVKTLQSRNIELNKELSQVQKKFEVTLNESTSHERAYRSLEHGIEHLKQELEQCERQKECALCENRRLQDDLASAIKDCHAARRELEQSKQEVDNLKRQLQQYCIEVQRAEELLMKKECERNEMLDHFRSLSLEATALETNNHTLESAVECTKTQLMSANNKLVDLEHKVVEKDSLVYGYEKQISELTTAIAELETKLHQQTELKIRAEEDLGTMRDLCSSIDGQKENLRRHASSSDKEKIHLMNEVRRLSEENEGIAQQLSRERALSESLENSLSNSRQETLEHKITNKDLQSNVHILRKKVEELTEKLDTESRDVKRYQSQCSDLCKQVSELRREVTNARFEQAKSSEDARREPPCRCCNSQDSDDGCFTDESHVRSNLLSSSRTYPSAPIGSKSLSFKVNLAADEPEITYLGESRNFKHNPGSVSQRPNSRSSCPCPCRTCPGHRSTTDYQIVSNCVSTAQGNVSSGGSTDYVRSHIKSSNSLSQRSTSSQTEGNEDSEDFKEKLESKSSRNIPPLTVLEENDREATSDSDDAMMVDASNREPEGDINTNRFVMLSLEQGNTEISRRSEVPPLTISEESEPPITSDSELSLRFDQLDFMNDRPKEVPCTNLFAPLPTVPENKTLSCLNDPSSTSSQLSSLPEDSNSTDDFAARMSLPKNEQSKPTFYSTYKIRMTTCLGVEPEYSRHLPATPELHKSDVSSRFHLSNINREEHKYKSTDVEQHHHFCSYSQTDIPSYSLCKTYRFGESEGNANQFSHYDRDREGDELNASLDTLDEDAFESCHSRLHLDTDDPCNFSEIDEATFSIKDDRLHQATATSRIF